MEKSKYIFIVLISFILSLTTQAATPKDNINYKEEIYKAYIQGDMNRWLNVIAEMEKPGA
ncbi:MAG: hypothetical protein LUD02_14955 [Tannerellaceae bacterium]|nr:hypothetical protein [Tannerellaceae bacterium]MCD8265284.1 hypothetical protein [Tannerellaceae bacterium]